MSDSYYIPGERALSVMGHLCKCRKCGRKILVELVLIGVPHHDTPIVTCSECLVLDSEFRNKNPDIAKQLDEWQQ